MKFGLLGEHLGHSYSPQIHGELYAHPYQCYEIPEDQVGTFLAETDLAGMNVTIPYKKTVMQYCCGLSETARRIGSVNTLVRVRVDAANAGTGDVTAANADAADATTANADAGLRTDGTGWFGYNTDYDGFCHMARLSGISFAGAKALVLGSGGASVTAQAALRDLGVREVVAISRNGENNYNNLDRHKDAEIIVNTTPVGMFPHNGEAPLSLQAFPACRGVLDVVYNPARTALLLEAEALDIPHAGGLSMLVAQARRSAELFAGSCAADGSLRSEIPDSEVARITRLLSNEMQNIILIGMPGSGKSRIAESLAKETGRPYTDADQEIVKMAGRPIPEIFASEGEEGFRRYETEVLKELGSRSGWIIATGGGCVTRECNYQLLHQNGRIFWLLRDLDRLPTEGRPLSQKRSLREIYEERKEKYRAFADRIIDNNGTVGETLQEIMKQEDPNQ